MSDLGPAGYAMVDAVNREVELTARRMQPIIEALEAAARQAALQFNEFARAYHESVRRAQGPRDPREVEATKRRRA